jgi:hypothetical protein
MQNKCDETPQPVMGRRPTTSQFIIGDRYPIFFPGHGHLEHVLKITNAFGLE